MTHKVERTSSFKWIWLGKAKYKKIGIQENYEFPERYLRIEITHLNSSPISLS